MLNRGFGGELRANSGETHASPAYRPDIDGMRACAVIAVVAYHAFPKTVTGGFVGVDVFFVISGFLISTILLNDLHRGTFSFAHFYARRVNRIFPALFVVLIAVLAFGWLELLADEYRVLGKHTAAAATFVSNFVFWSEAGYFDRSAELKPLLHLWSLAIEEQFYLVWPLLLWGAWRAGFGRLQTLVAVGVLSFLANVVTARADPVTDFFMPYTRFWELAAGGILAHLTLYPTAAFARLQGKLGWRIAGPLVLADILAGAGTILFLIAEFGFNNKMPFPGWIALVPVGGTVLLLLAGTRSWFNRVVLGHPVLVYIGLISYPLYLWHWPLVSFAHIVEIGHPPRWLIVACVISSLILAAFTHLFVEKPLRSGFANLPRVATVWRPLALTCLIMAVGSAGVLVAVLDGVRGRAWVAAESVSWPAVREVDLQRDSIAHALLGEGDRYGVNFFNGTAALASHNRLTAVIGDSHATVLYYALGGTTNNRTRIINIGRGTCLVLFDVDVVDAAGGMRGCQPSMNRVLQYVIETPRITDVILADFYDQYMLNEIGVVSLTNPARRDPAQVVTEGLRTTVSRLAAAGKNVIVSLDVPQMSSDPVLCRAYALRPLRLPLNNAACTLPFARYLERSRLQLEMMEALRGEFPQVKFFDPVPFLCDAGECPLVREHRMVYGDQSHLSRWGAERIGPALAALTQTLAVPQPEPAP